jgi:hypothetical protein
MKRNQNHEICSTFIQNPYFSKFSKWVKVPKNECSRKTVVILIQLHSYQPMEAVSNQTKVSNPNLAISTHVKNMNFFLKK